MGYKEDIFYWNFVWDRIVVLCIYFFDGVIDMVVSVVFKILMLLGMVKIIKFLFGIYVIGFESYYVISILKVKKFN